MTSPSSLPTRRDLRRSTSPARRAARPAAVTLGVALGLAAMVGTTASAVVPVAAPVMQRAALVTSAASAGAEPLSDIEQAASDAVSDAQAVVVDAATTTADVSAAALPIDGETRVDTTALRDRIAGLDDTDVIPTLLLPDLTDRLTDETANVRAATGDLRGRLEAAQAQKAAEEEAARIAAEQAAAAEAAAAEEAAAAQRAAEERASQRSSGSSASSSAPVSSGAPAASGDNSPAGAKATARSMLGSYGWGDDQFGCLESLWNKESGWNYQAYNSGSGAFGIPQALPGSKMASAGGDWQTSAATQISWGLGYISGRYGTPCGAWGHSQSTGWY